MSKTSAKVKNRYRAKAYDQINFVVPKGQKEVIKDYAKSQRGLSLNAYLLGLISQDMGDFLTVPGEAREPEGGE